MIRWIFRLPKLSALVAILFLSSIYLYVFPAANLTYVAIVLLHAAVGVVAAVFLVPKMLAVVRARSFYRDLGWLVLAAGAILGVILLFICTIPSHWTWCRSLVRRGCPPAREVDGNKRLAATVTQLVIGNNGFVSGPCSGSCLWRMEPAPGHLVTGIQVFKSCLSPCLHE